MEKPLSVLIIEDSASDAGLMLRQLAQANFDVHHERVETAEEMRAALAAQEWDIVLSDYRLPGFHADAALALLQTSGHDIPFIVVSGAIGEETAVELMRAGAHDYLMKNNLARLGGAVAREIKEARDRQEHRLASAALRESEERWKFALEGAGDGVWDWNVPARRVLFSRRWKEMLGYAENEIGCAISEWESRVHPDDLARVQANLKDYFDGKANVYASEHRMLCKDGSWKWVLDRGMLVSRTTDGQPLRMIGTHADITAQKKSEELIWLQANFDALTELPNRRMLLDRLAQELKKCHRAETSLALLFLDLDDFKDVNDTLGHDMGDLLLKQTALRIRACVRETDTVARLGGDEFTVILGELEDLSSVERVAQNILGKLAEPFILGEETAYISATIGITLYPEDATEIDELFKNADQAMYATKTLGRNHYGYFTPSMQQTALLRKRLTSDLRSALANQQFRVFYQPIVELHSGNVHKAEALIRWQHPTHGLVSPAAFIPIAEETGMISSIGDWIFRTAAGQAGRWRTAHQPNFQISINVSPIQFKDEPASLVNWFEHMAKLDLSGHSIVVEITEGLLMDTSDAVTDKLLAFRDAGMQVALDDFGTGYSSLSYIKKFDIDYLKIDQSFVRNLAPESSDMALCEAIIVMAHKLGLKVIAEGVETSQQRDLLLEAGCDYAQGYLFSRPIPAEEFEALVGKRLPLSLN